jgi:NAD(P)-dependent dehydrogenase (short-subunit alcohol dehydrogenase family)
MLFCSPLQHAVIHQPGSVHAYLLQPHCPNSCLPSLFDSGRMLCLSPTCSSLELTPWQIASGVFINNAGQAQPLGFFHEFPAETVDSLVAINCASVVKATHAVLPSMLARGRGAFVNIASVAGVPVSTPLLSLYSSTKSFVIQFSLSLSDEYKDKGIDFQVSAPPGITCMASCTEGMYCSLVC